MTTAHDVGRAAHSVLVRNLDLHPEQNLLIFADSGSLAIAQAVTAVATELGIYASIVFVPEAVQAALASTESLPLPIEAAIHEVDAVLSCLSDRPEDLNYRLRVLRTSRGRHTKVAHAPGITEEILAMADTDYETIGEMSRVLALAFILSRRVEITTEDRQGRSYTLSATTGGWDFPPGISDGVIPAGSWANLPPGEVYFVPQGAEGQIVINGSLPGRVLWPEEEIILTFHAGRLVDWQPEHSPAVQHLYRSQIAYAQALHDPNWANLAEVGIGLNPAVDHLTGIEVVDEKKANTLHVALGHSLSLGGRVDSAIHCDLITERPTVSADGRPLFDHGQPCVQEGDWRLDHRTVITPPHWWEKLSEVRRSGIRAEQDAGHRLICQWQGGSGRRDSAVVGSELTSRLAARVYELLPNHGGSIGRGGLVERAAAAGVSEKVLPALLWIMWRYDLLRVTEGLPT